MVDMKQSSYMRARRAGSAMGRISYGMPGDNPVAIFVQATELAMSRRVVGRSPSRAVVIAFADAFLVSWLRKNGRKPDAKAVRRSIGTLHTALLKAAPEVLAEPFPQGHVGSSELKFLAAVTT